MASSSSHAVASCTAFRVGVERRHGLALPVTGDPSLCFHVEGIAPMVQEVAGDGIDAAHGLDRGAVADRTALVEDDIVPRIELSADNDAIRLEVDVTGLRDDVAPDVEVLVLRTDDIRTRRCCP